MQLRHLTRDPLRLVHLVVGVVSHDRVPITPIGPQLLRLAAQVVGDDRVGRVEDRLRRPVVLLQHHDRDVRKGVLELEDVPHVRTPELVDRLVAVADDADVVVLLGQGQHEVVLDDVGVLVLVDQDVLEAALVVGEEVGLGVEELDGLGEEVVEVHGPGALEAGLVLPEDVADLPLVDHLGGLGVLVGRHAVVLGRADHRVHRPRREALRVERQVADHVAGEAVGVGLVVDRELLRIREPVGIPPEDPHASRVEGRDPHLLRHRTHQRADPRLHLVGGLVGEGDGQDLERADPVVADQVGDAVREHPRLARPGAGDDQQRAVGVGDRLRLDRVEPREERVVRRGHQTANLQAACDGSGEASRSRSRVPRSPSPHRWHRGCAGS